MSFSTTGNQIEAAARLIVELVPTTEVRNPNAPTDTYLFLPEGAGAAGNGLSSPDRLTQ